MHKCKYADKYKVGSAVAIAPKNAQMQSWLQIGHIDVNTNEEKSISWNKQINAVTKLDGLV